VWDRGLSVRSVTLESHVGSSDNVSRQVSSIHDGAADRHAGGMPYLQNEQAWFEVQDLINAGPPQNPLRRMTTKLSSMQMTHDVQLCHTGRYHEARTKFDTVWQLQTQVATDGLACVRAKCLRDASS
jgi:hypothetical protein